jgi:thymidylate synthase
MTKHKTEDYKISALKYYLNNDKGNCHIYEDHIDGAKIQINRNPNSFPTLSIKEIREDISLYQIEDFEIQNYQHHKDIKFKMVA